MKKGFLGFAALVLFLSSASTAHADYAVSVGFSSADYGRRHHRPAPAPYYNHGRYHHGYYYWPARQRVYTETVYVQKERPVPQETSSVISKEKLGISDIIVLAKAGVSDDNIIDRIAKTRSAYHLTAEEITLLSKEGVSNRVINFMISTVK